MKRGALGVVRECYSKWERRAPLTPSHVARLVADNIEVIVQPCNKRVFKDVEYAQAGARIDNDLSAASAIIGVKQVPIDALLPSKTYAFFSHTIKGQQQNMALLGACLEKQVRLVDYECVRRDGHSSAPRLIAFGDFAGKAGMINGFRGLGLRLLSFGFSTPFLNIGSAHSYQSYDDACRAISAAGNQIVEVGLPPELAPLVVAITGTGNVSRGAQHALSKLGGDVVEMVSPDDLPRLAKLNGSSGPHQRKIYATVVGADRMVTRREPAGDGGRFCREEYYAHPERYKPSFHEEIAPFISCLVTAMYWEPRFPRLLTLDHLRTLESNPDSRLCSVVDVTCDVGGAVESLVRSTTVDDPFYVYGLKTERAVAGTDGEGMLMLGVDILPAELPREASHHFGDALLPFIPGLLDSDPLLPWHEQLDKGMPKELWAATITSGGSLTPPYMYIEEMRRAFAREAVQEVTPPAEKALQGSTVVSLTGHLFDSGLINSVLDTVEEASGRFDLLGVDVQPNPSREDSVRGLRRSSALLQITLEQGRPALDDVLSRLRGLVSSIPAAEAELAELKEYCHGVYDRTLRPPTAGTAAEAPKLAATPSQLSSPTAAQPRASSPRSRRAPRSVLVLGAGLCAGPAVELLSRDGNDHVALISAHPTEAHELCTRLGRANVHPHCLSAVPQSEEDWRAVQRLVAESDAVLSLLPPPLHPPVAELCVEARTPMVTGSYVSPAMAALHERAKDAGVPILCEMGLDPGLDHMSAMRVIDAARAHDGVVRSFRSLCGGLPAPESVAADNLWKYKFSWSPAGVLSAIENSARYMEGGALVEVPAAELLRSAVPLRSGRLASVLNLEQLPNRDSTLYARLYGLQDAHTVFRGTLRYAGWSALMHEVRSLGFMHSEAPPADTPSWLALSESLSAEHAAAWEGASQESLRALRWLGALDSAQPLHSAASVRDSLCALMQARLSYVAGERDAAYMEHTFTIETPTTAGAPPTLEEVSSSLISFGTPVGGDSAMARAVGLTAAIGVERLMLAGDGRGGGGAEGVGSGVLLPTDARVYEYCLDRLAEEGFVFEETRRPLPL